MKIAAVDVFQVDLPYAHGTYRLSGGRSYTSFDATVVRLTADDGTEGWGESTPFGSNYIAAHGLGVRAGVAEIAPHLLGVDPTRVDRCNDLMDLHLVGHPHVKSALDLACWDLFGKRVGLPVHHLLGGSTGNAIATISSIGSGEPDDMRARVADHRARGYRGHSIKVGADGEGDPALDADRVAACLADRQAGEYFLVDANGSLTPEHALRLIRRLPPDADIVLEAPCATWTETLAVRRRTDVPIVIDELATDDASIVRAIADDACDGIGLKISKAGGLTAARRHRDLCRAVGFTMSVQDTWGGEIAFAAVLHLAQTIPSRLLRCVLDLRDASPVVLADLEITATDAGVSATDAPGLGVQPRLDVLGDPVATWS